MTNREISIIVGTCDLYSPLWKYFDTMFCRHWKLQTKNYFVSENVGMGNPNYIDVLPGNDLSWSERIIAGAKMVETPFTFFVLEDYLLTTDITDDLLGSHISKMKQYNIDKIVLAPNCPYYTLKSTEEYEYKRFSQNSSYLNTVQPAIWRTEFLIKCLNMRKFSPWEFEIDGTNLLSQTFHHICITEQQPIYYNAVRKGFQFLPDWEEFKIKHSLNLL